MKIAVFGDVHANLPALDAILQHAQAHGAEMLWNTGDLVGGGPFPEEVVSRLREGQHQVQGNMDRKIIKRGRGRKKDMPHLPKDQTKALMMIWTYSQLSKQSVAWLKKLPEQVRLNVEGKRVLIVHGSPQSMTEHLRPDTPEDRFRELAATSDADIVVCGHSHVPFMKKVDGVWFLNPGSVGRPDDGDPRASYAMLYLRPGYFQFRINRIEYPVDDTVTACQECGMPKDCAAMFKYGRSLDAVRQLLKERDETMKAICNMLQDSISSKSNPVDWQEALFDEVLAELEEEMSAGELELDQEADE